MLLEGAKKLRFGTEGTPLTEAQLRGRHPQVAGTKQPVRSTMPSPGDWRSGRKRMPGDGGINFDGATSLPALMSTDLSRRYSNDDVDMVEPSPTNESNQAPSLVDDDEEDEYEAHSSCASSSSEDQDDDLEVEVEDDEPSGPTTRDSSAAESAYSGQSKIAELSSPNRRPSAFRRSVGGREEKHVKFESPSPAREVLTGRRSQARKRKRT